MPIPLVDLKAQYETIKTEIDVAIARVLERTSFILGDEVSRFEAAFAAEVGAKGAAGVASGTAALRLALAACGIGPGDEVITTAHTFFATAEAVSMSGAKPVFVDVDPKTLTLDPAKAAVAITQRTRAILPVHLYGHPTDLDPLLELARSRDLFLIEDAAQAHGAEYRGKPCGSIGHLGCFSFYPGKNLGAYGDAGAVTGNDPVLLERVKKLRDHGRTSKYEHVEVGFAERMDGLQGAILAAKLPHLGAWTAARRKAARRYRELLEGFPITLPHEEPHAKHVYHLFVIRTSKRDALLDHLNRRGIGAGVHYPVPLHRQPAYSKLGYAGLSLPETEKAANEVLSLPLFPEITDEQILTVAEAVGEFFR